MRNQLRIGDTVEHGERGVGTVTAKNGYMSSFGKIEVMAYMVKFDSEPLSTPATEWFAGHSLKKIFDPIG